MSMPGGVASSAGLCVDAAGVRDPIAGPVLTAVLTAVAHVYEETEDVVLPCAWGMFAGDGASVDRGADCSVDPETGRECRGLVWVRLVNVFPSIAATWSARPRWQRCRSNERGEM
jgi:hypothetical protein